MSIEDQIIDLVRAAIDQALAERTEPERLALTVPEAARSIGCGPDLIRRLVKEGHLPTIPTGTRRVLIPVSALRSYVDSAATNPNQRPNGDIPS